MQRTANELHAHPHTHLSLAEDPDMIKKAIIGTGLALVMGLFFFGRDMTSYVRTSAGYVKQSVTDSVPVQFEIERARQMIDDLVPAIRTNMHEIAKAEVEVERLNKQIASAEEELTQDKSHLMQLKGDLATGKEKFQYAGRSYSVQQVKIDLANRFDRYKTAEATLTSLREIHDARLTSLDAAKQKLEGMLVQKRQLAVEVENLEARLQMVAAAQTTSDYNFDDSQLGRVKDLITDLKTRLDVAERMVDAEGYFHDQIPLEKSAPEDIVEQVTQYFGAKQPQGESVAQAD
jgi:peptidoglycan hydrolase CwlO-like protein